MFEKQLKSPLRSPLMRAILAGSGVSTPSYYLNLSSPSNVTIADGQANGTITSTYNAVITASMSPSRTTGVAPLYVNFDMTGTTSTDSTNPTHECFFATDFGDSGAGTWANGVQSAGLTSKNAGYGPVTGHVYETPGTYTVTMVVTDGVNTSSRTATIVVQDPNVVYAGALTICISHSGNFAGAPSGATQITAGSDDMYAAFNTYKASNKRILFCKADTWTCSASMTFSSITGMTVGGYGTGVAATFGNGTMVSVTPSALGAAMFNPGTGNTDIRICNLRITANPTTRGIDMSNTATQVTYYKVEIRGTNQGFNSAPGSGATVVDFDQHCLYECLVDDLYGYPFTDYALVGGVALNGGVCAFVSVQRGGIMGCYFDACNHGEQTLRIPHIDRGHVNNNYIARPNQEKNIVKVHSFDYAIRAKRSAKFVISANELSLRGGYSYNAVLGSGNTTQVGTPSIIIGNGGSSGRERCEDGIVENNITYACLGDPKGITTFSEIGCRNMTVRNNIADFSFGDRSTTFTAAHTYVNLMMVYITTSTPEQTTDVRVYNNTLYSNIANPEKANFVWTTTPTGGNPVCDYLTIKNNLWYLPHYAGAAKGVIYSQASSVGSNVTTSNNTDNGQTSTISPNFVATPPVALTDWRPNTGSYAIDTGASVPVLRDFNQASRVGGTYDLGAVLP